MNPISLSNQNTLKMKSSFFFSVFALTVLGFASCQKCGHCTYNIDGTVYEMEEQCALAGPAYNYLERECEGVEGNAWVDD